MQLAQRERVTDQLGGDIRVFDLVAQAPQRIVDDLPMVEGQFGKLVLGEPPDVVRLGEIMGFGLADQRPVDDGDHRQATVRSRGIAERIQLFKVARMQVRGGLQRVVGGLLQRTVGAQIAARQRPPPQKRLAHAAHQRQPQTRGHRVTAIRRGLLRPQGQDHHGDPDGRRLHPPLRHVSADHACPLSDWCALQFKTRAYHL